MTARTMPLAAQASAPPRGSLGGLGAADRTKAGQP
jgi:hypothetical protein